jgi:hypothetical protein
MKEIYEYKYLGWICILNINNDGSMSLTDSFRGKTKKFNDIVFEKIGSNGGERIQYNNNNVSLPFKNYSNGELDKHWRKIK